MEGRVTEGRHGRLVFTAVMGLLLLGSGGCFGYMGDLELIDDISHSTNDERQRRADIKACKEEVDYPKEEQYTGGTMLGVSLIGGLGTGGLTAGIMNSAFVDIQHRLILCLRQRGYEVEVTKRSHG